MSDSVQVTFILGKESRTVTAEAGESLLDTALRNDLNAPYSCLEGVCSACLAQIEEGAVDFPDDTILDDSEVQEGRVLTCQAKPKAGCLALKVNYDSV